MKRTLLFLALMASAAMITPAWGQVAAQTKRVLFVGNSYTSVNDLPQMTTQVALSMGDTLQATSNTPGGCTFQQHCQNQSMDLIRQGGWDAVVLQEQSQYPSFPDWQVQQDVFPYAARLVDSIYSCSPCAEPVFYMTWGRKNGDRHNADAFPPLGTYEGMDSLLALRYGQMARLNDASLCPVGRVWHRLRDEHPDIELYQADESHPSVAGTYAAACAFYVMLFHRDPSAIAYAASLSASQAAAIRQVVRSVVFDSLDRWQRPQPSFRLLSVDTVDHGNAAAFSLVDVLADTLFCFWGDGSADTLTAISDSETDPGRCDLQHLYLQGGTYDITLLAKKHCMTHTYTFSYTARTSGIAPFASSSSLRLWPNPASTVLHVALPYDGTRLTLTDAAGRILMRRHVAAGSGEGTVTLHIGHLPTGVYLLCIDAPSGTDTSSQAGRRAAVCFIKQ